MFANHTLVTCIFRVFSIQTDQCLLSAHWNYSSPHVQGKLIYCAPSANCMKTTQCDWGVQCVPSFILCAQTCFFTFVKVMCHSTSSNASDTCVAACLIGVVFTFIEGMCHSTSGYTINVHIRAFLCSSKAYVIAQVVTLSDAYVIGTERGWWT